MREMAQAIKNLYSHAVVVTALPRYNELYAKIQQFNRLLAWGHARALENVLKQMDCQVVIANPFGDASFLQHALFQKERRITLQ
jgi:ribonuclease HIII